MNIIPSILLGISIMTTITKYHGHSTSTNISLREIQVLYQNLFALQSARFFFFTWVFSQEELISIVGFFIFSMIFFIN
jgi:hypothetical protein